MSSATQAIQQPATSVTTPAQDAVVSPKTNWPYFHKAAFWNGEADSTLMKIVKFLTSFIILPIAFAMDLVTKGINCFSKTEKQEKPTEQTEPVKEKTLSKWEKAKKATYEFASKSLGFVKNHKLLTAGTALGALALAGGIIYRNDIGTAYCNKVGFGCKAPEAPKTEK